MKRMEGVAVGLVREVDARLGRVKVTFPWMDPPQASYWAPIASLLSGRRRGARFMPELDDEALIAFDRGEFDHPYVVGFLWNGADEAPDDVTTNRVVVTPGGHELRFEDRDGDRRVVVRTAGGHTLTLDDKAQSVTLESNRGHELEILDQQGRLTLATSSGGKVTLDDMPGRAVVEASQNRITLEPAGITIDAVAGALNINAAASVAIQAQGALNLTATGILNVTAPMATFSGVVQATTVIATSVISSSYSPGAGNLL